MNRLYALLATETGAAWGFPSGHFTQDNVDCPSCLCRLITQRCRQNRFMVTKLNSNVCTLAVTLVWKSGIHRVLISHPESQGWVFLSVPAGLHWYYLVPIHNRSISAKFRYLRVHIYRETVRCHPLQQVTVSQGNTQCNICNAKFKVDQSSMCKLRKHFKSKSWKVFDILKDRSPAARAAHNISSPSYMLFSFVKQYLFLSKMSKIYVRSH